LFLVSVGRHDQVRCTEHCARQKNAKPSFERHDDTRR
jgi:hypothetical protein